MKRILWVGIVILLPVLSWAGLRPPALGGIVSSATVTNFTATNATIGTQLNVPNGTASGNAAAYGQLVYISTVSQFTMNTATATTATVGYAQAGISQQITPTSASSRVEVWYTGMASLPSGTGDRCMFSLFRDSTNLATNTAVGFTAIQTVNAAGLEAWPLVMHFIDSPASTSAITYSVRFITASGVSCSINTNGQTSVLTVQELK